MTETMHARPSTHPVAWLAPLAAVLLALTFALAPTRGTAEPGAFGDAQKEEAKARQQEEEARRAQEKAARERERARKEMQKAMEGFKGTVTFEPAKPSFAPLVTDPEGITFGQSSVSLDE